MAQFPPTLGDHVFVLLALQRTGGINQHTARRQAFQRVTQDRHLPLMKINQIRGLDVPFDLRVARQRARSRTGRVHQNSVELGGKRQGLGGVQVDAAALQVGQSAQPVQVQVAGDGLGARFNRLGGLIARARRRHRGMLTGFDPQQRNDGLRTDILDAAGGSDVRFGRFEALFLQLKLLFRHQIGASSSPIATPDRIKQWPDRAIAPRRAGPAAGSH